MSWTDWVEDYLSGCLIVFVLVFLFVIGTLIAGLVKDWKTVLLSVPIGGAIGLGLYGIGLALEKHELWERVITHSRGSYTVGPWQYVRDVLPEGLPELVIGGAILGPIVASFKIVWFS